MEGELGVLEGFDDVLMHYASKYYDPVKAREYYLRTRRLKGRKPAMTKGEKKVWEVSQDNIGKASKAEAKALATNLEQRLAAISEKALASQIEIKKTMKEVLTSFQSGVRAQDLNKIPSDASPKQRAYLEAQNKRIIQKGVREAGKDANASMAKVAADYKSAISSAREQYAKARKALVAKYERISEVEANNIRAKVR